MDQDQQFDRLAPVGPVEVVRQEPVDLEVQEAEAVVSFPVALLAPI